MTKQINFPREENGPVKSWMLTVFVKETSFYAKVTVF